MLRLAVRGLAVHKLRAGLTSLAILLGVAMVAGALMMSDSVNRAFDDIFAEAYADTDVSIRAAREIESSFELPESGIAMPAELVERVEVVEGVEQAVGGIGDGGSIAILDEEGERIGPPQGGPPHIAASVLPEPFSPFTYTEGAPPSSPDEVAIDSFTARDEGFELGQEIPITGAAGLKRYELVGIARFGSGVPLGGASFAELTLGEAQRVTAKRGELDEISVQASEGVGAEELRDRLQGALGDSVQVRTGEQVAADDAQEIKDGFSFLTIAIMVFAGITVFVGAFLIFNTFSITVAQRTREFGMLRTLGASSRQVLGSVTVEAAVLGLVASLLGIAAGVGFVKLLLAVFEALGFSLPQSGLPLKPRTVIVALAVGMVATLFSASIPALRATRVSPLAALQDVGADGRARPSRRRSAVAFGLTVAGAVVIGLGLFSGGDFATALSTMGLGLIMLFIGIAMLGGRIVRPLASLVGRPIEALRGITGRLARENTLRNPSRTATTSSALMIGVALVVFVLMLGSAITKSVSEALDRTFVGDLAVYNVDGFSQISRQVGPALAEVEGVETFSPLAASGARLEGSDDDEFVMGLEPGSLTTVASIDWVEGSDETLAGLGEDGAIVESEWAEDQGIEVGDELVLVNTRGERVAVRVEGSLRDRIALLVDSVALPIELLRDRFDARQDFLVLAGFEAGADFEQVRDRVDTMLTDRFPNAEARSQQEIKDEQEEAIQGLLYLIYALLVMAVVLSLVGVVNTLVLTVLERKRELGMLRAIGASRSQVRRMVRYESVITAMIGAIVGAVIGTGLATGAVKALESEGLVLSFPGFGILTVLILAGIAGVVAGIWPARRASRIQVMEALQYE